MDSITDSIRDGGKVPGMDYASRLTRHVLPEEASRMGVSGDSEVLELRRTILADGEVVAYSYDLIPTWLLPEDFNVEELDGSLFAFFSARLGIQAVRGVAEVHAIHSTHIGWGKEAAAHDLFVLLDQVHYSDDDSVLMYSRTYFIEGRYNFTIRRTRG
ncbi:UTRA domain-containing protein [Acidipropionibacterium timonense]|uniref:UTRA domain-containing protein n=1 Tax=Acidipropionibacterium timonense TaxID=2161818 RepID=UPI001FD92627|nr:GntR family transcriptional regulator [Acidipropionibacterium timonense]